MERTIVAAMVTVSAVLSAQTIVTNTARITVLGGVSDASNSCVVTPTDTLSNGIVQLITVTTTGINAETAGKLFKAQDFGFEVKDCAQDSADPVTGVTMNISDTSNSDATILDSIATNGTASIGIGIQRISDAHRVAFGGSDTMPENYSAINDTQLECITGCVRTGAAALITEDPVKGVTAFTIDYTN